MAITTENRKRRVDTAGALEPTEVWNGKTWFDYNTNSLRIYSSTSGAWLNETDFTWAAYNVSDIVSVSGGAYNPLAP